MCGSALGMVSSVAARPGDSRHWEHSPGTAGTVGAQPGDGGQFVPAAGSTGDAALLREAACDSPEVGPTLNTCG